MAQPWRASDAAASGAASVCCHPVQGAVHSGPSPWPLHGYKGRPHGDLAVGDVLAGLARALGNNAAAQGAGAAKDAAGADFANNPEGQMELPGADIQPQRPFQIHGLFAL